MNALTQCQALYREAFCDNDAEFEKALFKNCFKYCKFIKENDKIVSMLFLLPTVFETESYSKKSAYIYAAATLKEYRGKGYMTKLIKEQQGDMPLFLRPANDNLIKFYEDLGFKTVSAKKINGLPMLFPVEEFLTLTKLFPDSESKENYTAMYFGADIKPQSLNFINTME